MISAFGVEHTVSKSFVGGKFVSASQLSAKQAAKVRTGGQYKKARGATKSDTEFKNEQTGVLQAARSIKPGDDLSDLFQRVKHRGFDRRNNAKIDVEDRMPDFRSLSGGGIEASASKFGNKRGGVNRMQTRPGASSVTLDHEKAHLAPNRTGYRMKQIAKNPKKLMREEARADAVADKKHNRPNTFGRSIEDVTSDPHTSGYAQAARGRDLSRSSEHVGSTRAGSAAKKVPGLRRLVARADQHVRGQYDAQIVQPSLRALNQSLNTSKPVKAKHLDDYKDVYNRVRGT